MKFLILATFISLPVFSQLPKVPGTMKDYSKEAMNSCKDDKSKVKGCENYTDIKLLKECLMKNEAQLSEKCKTALKLVK
jgi:hypothetical protein